MAFFNFSKITISLILGLFLIPNLLFSQNNSLNSDKFHFGGSLGLSIGSDFTNIVVAPSVIYDVNQYFSAGFGVQGSYINWKNNFESYVYGASLIGLINPIDQIQISAELEQLRFNTTYDDNYKSNFWNTGLFLGAGYRTNNVTVGVRYNLLFDEKKNIYSDPFMPFIRVYF